MCGHDSTVGKQHTHQKGVLRDLIHCEACRVLAERERDESAQKRAYRRAQRAYRARYGRVGA